jgi:hypothetical protein
MDRRILEHARLLGIDIADGDGETVTAFESCLNLTDGDAEAAERIIHSPAETVYLWTVTKIKFNQKTVEREEKWLKELSED